MRKLLTFFVIYFLSNLNIAFSQTFPANEGLTVTLNGYIINMGGLKIFQPCEDSSVIFLNSIDSKTFNLWCDRNDLYMDAIDKVGDSILVKVYDSTDKKYYQMNVSYFYCSLNIEMLFLNKDFEIFKEPSYEFYYDNKKYNLRYFFVRNRVLKIVPKNKKDLLQMYNYYSKNNYTAPDWLQKLANPSVINKSKSKHKIKSR